MLNALKSRLSDARSSNDAIWGQTAASKENVTFKSNLTKSSSNTLNSASQSTKSWLA